VVKDKMAQHIKKNDTVQIIAGDDKGSTGTVLRVIPKKGKVIVQGLNIALKHVKPSRKNPQGGRVRVEQPLDISNVLPVNPKSSKGTRIRFIAESDGSKKRVATDGTELGLVVKKKE
jgi:large subunit ribosomal protein L24